MRQILNLAPGFDFIKTEKALAIAGPRRGSRDIASPDTRQASGC
jgi:hypothetical protein